MTKALTVTAEPGVPYVDFVREFDAPVEALFEAHRDPAILAQWSGPDGYQVEIERYDFRTGGGYRYTHIDGENRYSFNGVFHVVRENEFAIQTFEFEGFPDVVSIESLRFEDLGGGRSRLVGHAAYPTQEARDGMVDSGMERGMSEGYRRLDAILAAS